jgi:RimJ/RimL family protein N-acetyltransferase
MTRSIVLSGTQVALARMTAEDQLYFQQWLANNEQLRAQIDDHRVPTLEDQRKWFERSQQPDRKMFSVVTLPGEELIGNGGFVNIDPAQRTATLRITIGNTGVHGKGLGTEATALLVRAGFEQLGLERIDLHVLKTNARAIRVYEKNGFRPAGDAPGSSGTLVMSLSKPA